MANTEDAASGLLGSTLLSKIESQSDTTPKSVSSGCPEIDDQALAGGFRYGEIASIAGASGTGKTAVRRCFNKYSPRIIDLLHQHKMES